MRCRCNRYCCSRCGCISFCCSNDAFVGSAAAGASAADSTATGTAATGSHMHNDYIDMLVLYGIPGYLFLCYFYFMPIIHFFKFQHIAKENRLFYVGLGAVMAIICLSFMSLSQCHFSDEEVQMIFWVAVGLVYHSICDSGKLASQAPVNP